MMFPPIIFATTRILLASLLIPFVTGTDDVTAPDRANGQHINVTLSDQRSLSESSTSSKRVMFYAMGDGPYGSKARKRFASLLGRMESRPEFLIHLGDVHERQKDCVLSHYDTTADTLLEHVRIPTFAVPGDADWYECNNQTAAWNTWQGRFLHFHEHWQPHGLEVVHQAERPENFAFVHKKVLFLGLHVLYSTVQDWNVWDAIVHDDAVWLQEQFKAHSSHVGAIVMLSHAYAHPRRYHEFYNLFMELAQDFHKPILYLQGDSHNFVVDRKFPPRNILRVVVDRLDDALQVTVDPSSKVPFQFKRQHV